MKKFVIVLIVALGLFSCQKSVKIAYIDVEEIMKEYKGTKDTEEAMKVKSDKLKLELDSLISNWQNKAKAYQDNAPKMSAKARAEREQSLMQEQQQINQRQQTIQQQVQQEGQESLEALSNEISDFVKSYAKEKGYNFVLGTSGTSGTVIYGDEASDVTDEVLIQLNKSYKSK
ncbi:OmpH family outer membrane protein [Aureibaculum marinum]|uniref:OmpH family outer membrane protein n=1 Tax=Aureibaculum marinum TaxID=2487930 RepID=A0A3N4NTZ3_9FLAO|nr:OmpH family outer membrane protein [Aureibaculum marinum]RPD96496.1 OmpH family outer membrane protein [Aureibaculum marinum]